jgi:hypothetical protein
MRAKVSGQVMEIHKEYDDKNNLLASVTAMIFQKGEKNLVAVKKVPSEVVEEGFQVDDLPVHANAWSFNGKTGMTAIYTE